MPKKTIPLHGANTGLPEFVSDSNYVEIDTKKLPLLTFDFGREDLNLLRDAVNKLIERNNDD